MTVRHNTAIALDTDTVFHGVDRVSEERVALPRLGPDAKLRYAGDGRWELRDPGSAGTALATYDRDDLRLSISWKAYCFSDADEERAVRDDSDDLTRERALERLCADLRRRGRLGESRPDDTALAHRLMDEYVKRPPAR